MSSFDNSKSSLDFVVDRRETSACRDAESLNLDRRKNKHDERDSSTTTSIRPEFPYIWKFRQALLVACITAFLVSISSYDPSHAGPASQDTFSSVCFPTNKCLLRLYLPNALVNPPAIVFVTSVLGFFTLIFVLHGIRRADIYQDQILALGVICGSILCGFLAFQGEGLTVFKNVMPGTIAATLAISAMIHVFLEKRSNAYSVYAAQRRRGKGNPNR